MLSRNGSEVVVGKVVPDCLNFDVAIKKADYFCQLLGCSFVIPETVERMIPLCSA
jgi:hypothetical protein